MFRSRTRQLCLQSALIMTLSAGPLLLGAPVRADTIGQATSQTVPAKLRYADTEYKTYSADLQSATGERASRVLDARTPRIDLRFNLSDAALTDQLYLTLSADPLSKLDPDVPLIVQFNDADPVVINTKGRGFTTKLRLDARKARGTGNVLRLSYEAECSSAGYIVSLDQSHLDLRARPRSRRLQLREVERRLRTSVFAPDVVGLVADGPEKPKLQALGAQALGLRMTKLPRFDVQTADADFNLVMLKRDELPAYTNDVNILTDTGPRIVLARGNHDTIFLTGDTDTEVMQSVQAFASHHLPQSYRSLTTPGEVRVQTPLGINRIQIEGDARLGVMSGGTGAVREFSFDLDDPAMTHGDLRLELRRDDQTAPGVRMKAMLNGTTLGEATLDTRDVSVTYPIQSGDLKGHDNRLQLITLPGTGEQACTQDDPFIAVSRKSALSLNFDQQSPVTDLSRLAANGTVFASQDGANTRLVLPTSQDDLNAALQLVAQLGRVSGRGWTEAEFVQDNTGQTERRLLILKPLESIEPGLLENAPSGLLSAFRGQTHIGPDRLSSVERFASLDTASTIRMSANMMRGTGTVGAGGVASIYAGYKGQLTGIISNTPGENFESAMSSLLQEDHWSHLGGGVSRWNDDAVIMAQVAQPDTEMEKASLEQMSSSWTRILGLDHTGFVNGEWPSVEPLFDHIQKGWSGLVTRLTPGPKTRSTAEIPDDLRGSNYGKPERKSELFASSSGTFVTPSQTLEASSRKSETSGKRGLNLPEMPDRIDFHSMRQDMRSAIGNAKRWAGDSRRDINLWLNRMEVKSSEMRRDLRRLTGLKAPELRDVRFGNRDIPPGVLALILVFIMAVVGLIFVSPKARTGHHH